MKDIISSATDMIKKEPFDSPKFVLMHRKDYLKRLPIYKRILRHIEWYFLDMFKCPKI